MRDVAGHEVFELSPTAYEETVAKERAMSLKKKQARARRMLKKRSWVFRRNAPAANHAELLVMQRFCEIEQIEMPLWARYLLMLHEAAQREPARQLALFELEVPA